MSGPISHDDARYIHVGSPAHAKVIGCSTAANILGHGFQTPMEVWMRLTGKSKPTPHKRIFDRGHAMEDHIVKMMLDDHARHVTSREVMFVDPERPWLIAHVDGLLERHQPIGDPGQIPHYAGVGYFEAKAPGSRMASQYKDAGLPGNYIAQGQMTAHLVGAEKPLEWGCYAFMDYDEWKLVTFDVPTNLGYIEVGLQMLDRFWEHVQADTPPEDVIACLGELPEVSGEVEIVVDHDPVDLMRQLIEMSMVEKEAKSEMKRLKSEFAKTFELGKYQSEHGKVNRLVQQGRITVKGPELLDYVDIQAEEHGFDFDRDLFLKVGKPSERITPYPNKEMKGS
jgi:hypothetical protein